MRQARRTSTIQDGRLGCEQQERANMDGNAAEELPVAHLAHLRAANILVIATNRAQLSATGKRRRVIIPDVDMPLTSENAPWPVFGESRETT